ncbi:MAG TPA: glycosyltransferase [Sulfurospirillum arcachonense]|nr:glycosyltransferase [Sulfurospirillum arcachonense]
MSKKRILIVANSLAQGGAERVISILLARFYDDSAFDVQLVLLEDTIAYDLPKGVNVTCLSSVKGDASGLKKILYIPWLALKLYKYVKKTNADLVVSFIYRADYVNVLASLFHKKTTIVSARVNASSTYANNSINAKINKALIRFFYKKATMVINVSEGTKQDLVENFAIETEKQIVIYNPYDSEKIQKLSNEPIDFAVDKEKTMVAVSRFRPIKNIAMILRAFASLAEDTKLILVGDGSEEHLLLELADELGIRKRVLFVGGQDNPYKFMSKASIYISSSRSEGFPNAMVEAMICGCSVLSTDCPSGPREILAPTSDITQRMQSGIEYSEFGTLVAVDDTEAMGSALAYILSHDDMIKDYVKKSSSRVKDFQLENIYKQYSDTFNAVIEDSLV